MSEIADNASAVGDLVRLVWQRKLWWLVPLLLAMMVLGALVLVGSTPIGPLLYPVF
jgi:hypothetical protein